MSTRIECPVCKGSGSANNPPVFHNAGETPEVSINCSYCFGQGYIEVESLPGTRATFLVSKKIYHTYPQFHSWEEVYQKIGTNIINAVNASISSASWFHQPIGGFSLDNDSVFSDNPLPIDSVLEKWIEKGNYLEEAKTILGIRD